MEGIEPTELLQVMNYIGNDKERLARRGHNITYILPKHNVLTGKVEDISFLDKKLIKYFSTKFEDGGHKRLYDQVMEWLWMD